MLFRFASALLLVVAVSMTGVVLEKQTLKLRRLVSRQYYQTDLLLELHAQRRLKIQQLTAASQLIALEVAGMRNPAARSVSPTVTERPAATLENSPDAVRGAPPLPLLRWERPVNPAVLE